MKHKITKTKIAGLLMLLGGVGHLVPSLMGTWQTWTTVLSNGWWNKIQPPWTRAEIELQSAFWKVWGSFAIPLILIGFLILWLDKQKIKIPVFFSVILIIYSLLVVTLIPQGGFWILLTAGFLLLADKPTR